MIDTIALMIDSHDFKIRDYDKFAPSARGLFEPPYYTLGARGSFSCYQNPTKKELKNGIYKPRLTTTKRIRKGGFPVVLKIELSLPKLLYKNNFDELEEKDFETIITRLSEILFNQMGVAIPESNLRNAPVSVVHYSKNIPLTNYTTPSMILHEIEKINLSSRLDLSKTKFQNSGHALYHHTNDFELVFYDKIKDLEQAKKISGKRSMENDQWKMIMRFKQIFLMYWKKDVILKFYAWKQGFVVAEK